MNTFKEAKEQAQKLSGELLNPAWSAPEYKLPLRIRKQGVFHVFEDANRQMIMAGTDLKLVEEFAKDFKV